MKIILSRKGFDSENGGIPSLIMPDGKMVSFPIPSDDDDTFNDLWYDRLLYSDMISDVKGKPKYDFNDSCHVDPDLAGERRVKKPRRWEPGFGQAGAALSYLMNSVGVEPGDLFLFFGWFHQVEDVEGHLRYVKRSGNFYRDNDLHVIWGYLQVGDILKTFDEKKKRFPWHPHSNDVRQFDDQDYIFAATKSLSFAPDMPGAGILPFSEKRVLTMKYAPKATWKTNAVYMPNAIIGNRKNSANDEGLYYSGVWQELGLKETKAAENWAKKMITAK